MKNFVTLDDINNNLRIGISGLYLQLLQNIPQVVNDFKFRNYVEDHYALEFSAQSFVSLHTNDTN